MSALFKLVICKLDAVINFDLLLLLIGTIICFLEGPFVVMLILGFTFLELLIELWIFSIFFAEKLEKFSLSFKISSTYRADT